MKLKNKVIVVTGGGSGMGRQLTLKLLHKGAMVAIADVNEMSMEETRELAGDLKKNLSLHKLDITDREMVMTFPETVKKIHGKIDGIINNAGIIQPFIPVHDLDFDRIEKVMNINFFGTLNMTKAFLPFLLKRPVAHIANVSSMGGFIAFPGQTLYSASKAAVKLLTEGLYAELEGTSVRVTLIIPGAVNTNIMTNSGLEQSSNSDPNTTGSLLQPEKAAEMVIHGIEKDKFRVLIGRDASLLDKLYRLVPAWTTRFVAKKMKRPQ